MCISFRFSLLNDTTCHARLVLDLSASVVPSQRSIMTHEERSLAEVRHWNKARLFFASAAGLKLDENSICASFASQQVSSTIPF